MKLRNFLLGFVLSGFVFAVGAQAQLDIRGQITGRVVNEYSQGVRRVNVMVMNLTTLDTQITRTSDYGYFRFDDLPVGDFYIVHLESSRFYLPFPTQTVNLDTLRKQVIFNVQDFPVNPSKAPLRDF